MVPVFTDDFTVLHFTDFRATCRLVDCNFF